jgi:hypothetical protein
MRFDERIERHHAELGPRNRRRQTRSWTASATSLSTRPSNSRGSAAPQRQPCAGCPAARLRGFQRGQEHTRSIRSSGMPLGPAVVRRRPAEFRKVLQAASATGAATILFGPRARRLAADDALWLECPVDGANAFDSYAAVMSLVSVLANGVLMALTCRPRAGAGGHGPVRLAGRDRGSLTPARHGTARHGTARHGRSKEDLFQQKQL